MWKKILAWLKKLLAEKVEKVTPSTTTTDPPVTPPASDVFTVSEGQRIEKTMSPGSSVSFDLTGKVPTDENVEAHLAWMNPEGVPWNGGNIIPAKEIPCASFKDYKLKCNGFGEPRYDVAWDPTKTYRVTCYVGSAMTSMTVALDGKVLALVSVEMPVAGKIVLGIGWPPSKRKGALGAKYRNIVWTDAGTK